jgi:hypothetical protein
MSDPDWAGFVAKPESDGGDDLFDVLTSVRDVRDPERSRRPLDRALGRGGGMGGSAGKLIETPAGSGGGGASGEGKLRLSRSLLGDIRSSVVVAAAPSDGRIDSSKLKLLATNESANWQSFDSSLSLTLTPFPSM